MKRWWNYFGRLFPSRKGFSPYRFPGTIVHIPLAAFIAIFGFLLCYNHVWLWPLIPVYLIIGFYAGRDLAIYAHYNILITIAVIAGIIFLPSYAESVKAFTDAIAMPLYGLYSFLISAAIVAAFYFYARHWAVVEAEAEKEAEARAASPLHYAAETGHLEKCRELLGQGADLNIGDSQGLTPLHNAARDRFVEIVEVMLAHGACVNLKTYENKMESLRDCTPLHFAAQSGSAEMVELLIKKGADVNAKTYHQYTPLHYAALKGDLKIAQMLLAAGADINVVEVGGFTALQLAEKFENKKVADFLGKIR